MKTTAATTSPSEMMLRTVLTLMPPVGEGRDMTDVRVETAIRAASTVSTTRSAAAGIHVEHEQDLEAEHNEL